MHRTDSRKVIVRLCFFMAWGSCFRTLAAFWILAHYILAGRLVGFRCCQNRSSGYGSGRRLNNRERKGMGIGGGERIGKCSAHHRGGSSIDCGMLFFPNILSIRLPFWSGFWWWELCRKNASFLLKYLKDIKEIFILRGSLLCNFWEMLILFILFGFFLSSKYPCSV